MHTQRIHRNLYAALAAAVPAFLGLSVAPAQDTAPPAAQAEKLPSAREVIDRHIAAIGAKDMVEKTTSSHMKGSIVIEGIGLKGTFERFSAKPDKKFEKSTMDGVGDTQGGFDGQVAWTVHPMMGTMVMEGAERFQTAMDADYDSVLMPAEDYEKLEVQGREKFEGRDCYKLLAVYRAPADPQEAKDTEKVRTTTSWFDVETGYQAGVKVTAAQGGMQVPMTIVFADYKKFGDYSLPAKTTMDVPGAKVVITTTEVVYDQVDPKVFELPEGVRALIKDAKAPVSAGSGGGGGG